MSDYICANGLNKSGRTLTWKKLRSFRVFLVQASVNKALKLINIPRTTARWKVMKGDNALRFSQCMRWAHGHTGKKYKSEKVTT